MKEERQGLGIPYSIRNAEFGGKGIFTTHKIIAGTLVWTYAAGENVVEYDGEAAIAHLESLTLDEAKRFLDTTYGLGGKTI